MAENNNKMKPPKEPKEKEPKVKITINQLLHKLNNEMKPPKEPKEKEPKVKEPKVKRNVKNMTQVARKKELGGIGVLSEAQYELLSRYEKTFQIVLELNYMSSIDYNELEEIKRIYTDVYKKKPDINCAYCVYSLVRLMGNIYYKAKEKYGKEKK